MDEGEKARLDTLRFLAEGQKSWDELRAFQQGRVGRAGDVVDQGLGFLVQSLVDEGLVETTCVGGSGDPLTSVGVISIVSITKDGRELLDKSGP